MVEPTLSEDSKKRIEKEERYRKEVRKQLEEEKTSPKKVEKESDKAPWWKPKGCGAQGCALVVGILILGGIISGFSSGDSKIDSSKSGTSSAPAKSAEQIAQEQAEQEKKRKETVNELSSLFCENRQGEYSYGIYFCGSCVNLGDIVKLFESEGTVTIHNAGGPPTEEDCRKVADYCLKGWEEEDCRKIAEQKIWIGMTKSQLYISWGVPRDQNDTVGSWGVHSQWVYGDFGPYVYLEGKSKDDLVVTSWQD